MLNTTQWLKQLEYNDEPRTQWQDILNILASESGTSQCAIMLAQDEHFQRLITNENHPPICDWESIDQQLTSLVESQAWTNETSRHFTTDDAEFQIAFAHTPLESVDVAPIYLPNGQLGALLCAFNLLSPALQHAVPQLARLISYDVKHLIEQQGSSLKDELTQLLNPQGFETLGSQKVKDAPRYQLAIGVIHLQIDRVDEIRAAYGSAAADECYVTLSEVMKSACRDADIVARISCNEFVVLSLLNNRRQLNQLAQRIDSDYRIRVKNSETLNLSALLAHTFITDGFSALSLSQLVEKAKFGNQ
ncbi:diguanylate cyclase domain-containing protein [Vibrio olivae]|uniref:Diguanylate cyclase domain-containing protein n=1 Tax=Vibrio olivae TaxID=1243002 RepID=A0ABV5HPQ8_9VIBR